MKVLLIDNFHYRRGGAEVVYLNTGDMLKEHGHSVVFFSQEWEENIDTPYSRYFPKGISFRAKGFINKVGCLIHYFYNLDAKKQLEKLIEIEKPDVAHIHLFWGGLSPSIYKVLKAYSIPIVHSVHDYRMVCPGYTFKNGKDDICEQCEGHKFYKCAINKCSKGSFSMSALMTLEMYYRNLFHHPADYIDEFLFVSEFSKKKHLQYDQKFKNCRTDVLYNFTNSDVINSLKTNIDTYNSYYLFYGRLSFEKGTHTLIKAFVNHPELKLIVVGTGPLEDELKKECESCNCQNIEFVGYKTGAELYNYVANAKFVCVPSECYENNPMTIVESYSLQTPVIGAAIGGITEIVKDGLTGFTFNSGDVRDLETALEKSTSITNEIYTSMKQNAQRFANENFNGETYCQKLLNIYQDLINKER